MKKLLLLMTMASCMYQSHAQETFALGIKAGFNSTKIKLSNIPSGTDIKNEAKSGFLIGAFAKLKLSESLAVQPEIYYAKKNTDYTFDGTSYNTTYHTYDIPLLLNIKIIDLKVAKIYGLAGPVASFNAKTSSDYPEFEEVKNANWTFQAGGGLSFWKLTADVRYEWGLKDISNIKENPVGQKTDILTFSIGYRLIGL